MVDAISASMISFPIVLVLVVVFVLLPQCIFQDGNNSNNTANEVFVRHQPVVVVTAFPIITTTSSLPSLTLHHHHVHHAQQQIQPIHHRRYRMTSVIPSQNIRFHGTILHFRNYDNHHRNANARHGTIIAKITVFSVGRVTADGVAATTDNNNDGTTTTTTTSTGVQYLPSFIVFHNVTQKYPRTILRQLLSSVPYRPYAIRNISFVVPQQQPIKTTGIDDSILDDDEEKETYSNGFLLLTGASSSGKSTILQTIVQAGTRTVSLRQPTHGTVSIGTLSNNHHHEPNLSAKPILLDTITISEYRMPYESTRTLANILTDDINTIISQIRQQQLTRNQPSPSFSSRTNSNRATATETTTELLQTIMTTVVNDLWQQVEIFPHAKTSSPTSIQAAATTTTSSQLSTSQQYKWAILRACLYSMFGNIGDYPHIRTLPVNDGTNSNKSTSSWSSSSVVPQIPISAVVLQLPGPILLLDECLDQETSPTIQCIQSILQQNLGQFGAIVISTTHYPERWKASSSSTSSSLSQPSYLTMTLCHGEILTTTAKR